MYDRLLQIEQKMNFVTFSCLPYLRWSALLLLLHFPGALPASLCLPPHRHAPHPHPHHPEAVCEVEHSRGSKILSCDRGLQVEWTERIYHQVETLVLSQWPEECFSPGYITRQFPGLQNLTIHNSSFSYFNEKFTSSAKHLKILKLKGFKELVVEADFLSDLPSLEELDLRGNLFTRIHPDFISSPRNLKRVYLVDNMWNCSNDGLRWLSRLNSTSSATAKERIVDYKNLTCRGTMYPGKPIHVVMDILKTLREECPPTCLCHLTNLVQQPGKGLVPVSTVDCRGRGLKVLPPAIPKITTALLLHRNNITEIRPLSHNLAYRRVSDVYLDDNHITSLQPLEGADWLLTFRVLSLRGNNITQLPTHAFDNALEQNENADQVYLGVNPWRCDCHFTPGFQDLLLKYKEIMKDLQDVTCPHSDNKELSKAMISTLSRSIICRKTSPLLQPLDILNVVLASLIILVLGKLAYDYYFFKKTGKVPWIVSKMP